jgi:UPF0755 protein|tara:strand:- start:1835 stop:2986 length:1152 start_codon:yes stop_codon:yes gene_type:complete
MWRNIASNTLTIFVVSLFLLGGFMSLMKSRYYAPGPLAEAICVKVESGSSMSKIAAQLGDQGAVISKRLFHIGVDYTDKANDLKAGNFLIPAGASMAEIAGQITTSGRNTCGTEVVYRVGVTRTTVLVRELDPATSAYVEVARFDPDEEVAPEVYSRSLVVNDTRIRFAVAEGTTSWQIVESLKAIDALDGDIAEIPSEGTLAPDSYEIKIGDLRIDILAKMALAQDQRLREVWAARDANTPVKSIDALLVLASIIEKETGVSDERFQVASVFANRLEQGMPLQTDPTVIYGITMGKGPLGRGLRKSELRRDTPWNTYLNRGLPPTAIANPGVASLQAALNPAETDYIFFVADGTGGHAFAVTLKEHNRNVATWRKIEAERNQ